jgi:GAF domain-containing protein
VASPGPGAVYEAALDAICDGLQADCAAVLLFDPDGVIRFKAARGLSEAYRAAVEGHSPWTADETAPKPILIPDVAAAEDLGHLRDTILGEGIRAVAFVPLAYAGRLLGKFMSYHHAPHSYTDDEIEFAQTVSAHIAFALEQRRLEEELRLANDQLSATLHAVDDAIVVRNPEGSILFANEAAARLLGFPDVYSVQATAPGDITARYDVFDEAGELVPAERLPGRLALAGESPPETLLRYHPIDGRGDDKWSVVRATPVTDGEGRLRFAVSVFRDVTERQRASAALRQSEARLELLAGASPRLLAASLDDRQVLQTVAAVLVPGLADSCTIWELSDAGLHPAVSRPEGAEPPPGTSEQVVLDAVGAGRARLLGEPPSALVVPLEARGHPVGAIVAGRVEGGTFDQSDLALARDVAGRAALAFDNARLFRERSRVAETLQEALLPPHLPEIPGVEVSARYRPAASDVGGDFYDIVPVGPDRWMVVVGDVCGKGVEAASLTAVARSTVQALATEYERPSELLRVMNSALLRQLSADRFCTITCLVVDVSGPNPQVTVSLAGQPRPLVVHGDGSVSLAGRHGTVLGILPEVEVDDEEVVLGSGDSLVLYTDGCLMALPAGGEEMLLQSVSAQQAASVSELAALVEAAGPPEDDVTVLALRISDSR